MIHGHNVYKTANFLYCKINHPFDNCSISQQINAFKKVKMIEFIQDVTKIVKIFCLKNFPWSSLVYQKS
jgi:hypothetical protein